MTFFLELKEKLIRIYEKNERSLRVIFKFFVAILFLILLTNEIGYLSLLRNPLIIIVASVICAFTPRIVTLITLSTFFILHIFAVSQQLSVAVILVLILMYLTFFRFCPEAVYILLLTIFCCLIKIPFALPIVFALAFGFQYIFAMSFGIIIYYIIRTVSIYLSGLTLEETTENARTLSYLTEALISDKTMLTLLISFAIIFVIVNLIRRIRSTYAWVYAIIIGVIVEFLLLVIVDIWLSASLSLPLILIGTSIGGLISFVYNLFVLNIDYAHTKYLQFDDEEYYYYVKAVPKRNVTITNVKVTHINTKTLKAAEKDEKNEGDIN